MTFSKEHKHPSLPIAVLGGGSWGTALAIHLARAGHSVLLWSRDAEKVQAMHRDRVNYHYIPDIPFPKGLEVSADLTKTIETTGDIVVAVPSIAVNAIFKQIASQIRHKLVNRCLICVSKGLDQARGLFFHQLAAEYFTTNMPFAILSGPSFALEVAQGKPTSVMAAAHDPLVVQHVVRSFSYNSLNVFPSNDIIGIELASIMKNVLAIAVGFCDGLELGYNTRSALITQGLAEMTRLGLAIGGKAETFTGLAGLGDLVLTCTGHLSRNRRFGLAIGQGKTCEQAYDIVGQVVEGFYHVDWLLQLAKQQNVMLPIVYAVQQVLSNKLPVQTALKTIMSC